jgi:hypothetical protein
MNWLWVGRSQGLNSGKSECFLHPPKRPDWLLGQRRIVVSIKWPFTTGIKRPESEPKKITSIECQGYGAQYKVSVSFTFQVN